MKRGSIFYPAYMMGRILPWKLGDKSPISATLKLTYRCNLSCLHCPWHLVKSQEIPTEEWKQIIHQLYQAGVRHIVFEGGEPTLRPDLEELVSFAREKGAYTTIATNGIKDLSPYHPHRFLISIDGLKETHDQIRGKGSFEKILLNLKSAPSRRELLISISQLNKDELEDICRFFQGKVDGLWFSFVYDYSSKEPLSLNREEMTACAQKLLFLKRKYPIINFSRYLKQVGRQRPCAPWLLWTVLPDGSTIKNCMILAIDKNYDCSRCELACHREISLLLDPFAWLEEAWAWFKSFRNKGTDKNEWT